MKKNQRRNEMQISKLIESKKNHCVNRRIGTSMQSLSREILRSQNEIKNYVSSTLEESKKEYDQKIETIDSHVRNLMDSTHQQQNTVDAKEITQKVIDLENRLIELENSQEPPTSLDLPKDKGQIHVHKSFIVVRKSQVIPNIKVETTQSNKSSGKKVENKLEKEQDQSTNMDPPSKIKHEEANLEEMKTDQLPEKNVNNETS